MHKQIYYNNNEEKEDEDDDEIHSMRIKEFMILTENTILQRPKCSISPIDSTNNENNNSSLLVQNNSTQAYLMPISSNLPIQSTPNRQKINFHSISDLATPSSSSSYNSTQSSISFNSTDNSIYQIPQALLSYNSGISFHDSMNNNVKENCPLIDFYASPNLMSYQSETKRKPRTQITKQHRQVLERVYSSKKYPDSNEIEYLTHLLGFDENVIRIWFQNKRARDKLKRL